ncbi:unnamed protein product [Lathyrus sativus]|nr:unnamed protein product [Lathyrus sativus]
MIIQKARTSWVREGDLNTKYFHSLLKCRTRRNAITALKSGNIILDDVNSIKYAFKEYFANMFSKLGLPRPRMNFDDLTKLSPTESAYLEKPFGDDEVRSVVFNCNGNKSPGPDGFNFDFLKSCWDFVGTDVSNCIKEFHSTTILPKALISSFIA